MEIKIKISRNGKVEMLNPVLSHTKRISINEDKLSLLISHSMH